MKKRKKKVPETELTIDKVILKKRQNAAVRQGYVDLVVRIVFITVITVLLLSQVFMITQARGMAMFPSIKDGDLIIANRLQREYMQNDVVVYEADGKKQVGRVVAKTSEIVMIDDSGTLLVNGVPQTGEILYPTYPKEGITYPVQVGEDEVFILGDYRTQAVDSRDYGVISEKDVKGEVMIIIRRRGL